MSLITAYGNGVTTDFPVPSALAVASVTVGGSGVAFTQPLGRHMIRLASAPAAGVAVVIDIAENPVPSEGGGGGGGPISVTNPASSPVPIQMFDEANPLGAGVLNQAFTFTRPGGAGPNTPDASKTVTLTRAGARRTITFNSADEILTVSAWSPV